MKANWILKTDPLVRMVWIKAKDIETSSSLIPIVIFPFHPSAAFLILDVEEAAFRMKFKKNKNKDTENVYCVGKEEY